MNGISKKKINYLFSYLHDDKYREQLLKSIKVGLFDFGIILIWKTVMLFTYEKLHQIEDRVILEKWKEIFGRNNKPSSYKPKYFDSTNLYWPNTEDDETILEFLGALYSLDRNIIKLVKSCSQKRDTASHVFIDEFDIQDLDGYINETLKCFERFQKKHNKKYLRSFDLLKTSNSIIEKRLSWQDISFLLDLLIESFSKISNFEECDDHKEEILNLKPYLGRDKISKILLAIQKNSPDCYHQILEAGSTPLFLKKLYNISSERSEEWQDFVKFVKQRLKEENKRKLLEYNWLFEKFGMDTSIIEEEEDIPF